VPSLRLAPRLVALGRARPKKLLTRVDRLLRQIEAQEKKASPTHRQRWQKALRSARDTRGALLVRAGKSADAAVLRERTDWREQVFLALARHGQGNDREARAAAQKARTARPTQGKTWSWDAVEADLLPAEVERLIRARDD
jgi:hypothetical protein